MGKPTGFIEYLRELPLDRSAIERIREEVPACPEVDEVIGFIRASGRGVIK